MRRAITAILGTAALATAVAACGGGSPSAQCQAAVRANNAYVASIVAMGPLTMPQQYDAFAGAKPYAQAVNRLCPAGTKIEELTQ